MKTSSQEHLPLRPLLNAYLAAGLPSAGELGRLPGLGPRFAAVLSASARFLYPAYLDEASDADLGAALERFYEAVVDPPLHADALRRGVGLVRHGLGCLLRGRDALPTKLEACASPGGPYHVAGLGPVFWSALFQAAQRKLRPGWTPAVLTGLRRLGLAALAGQATPDRSRLCGPAGGSRAHPSAGTGDDGVARRSLPDAYRLHAGARLVTGRTRAADEGRL